MANKLTFSTHDTSGYVSNAFEPRSSVVVQAVGAIASGSNFQVEQSVKKTDLDTNDGWTKALTSPNNDITELTNGNAILFITTAKGFQYRVKRTAGTSTPNVFWGPQTDISWFSATTDPIEDDNN